MTDPRDVVRHGYDALSYLYRADDAADDGYAEWIDMLAGRLPAGAAVLDLGCGCGIPVSRALSARGFRVTGVDISDVQIERARTLVPDATFVRADAMELEFADDSFDAVVSLFALIHLPLDDQPALLSRIGRWLRPDGLFLATTGHTAWTGSESGWLGGEAPMWWSHADAATYWDWITSAGLTIETQDFVPEGDGGHALFWARRD